MARYRFWIILAVVAGAALFLLNRPGDDDPPAEPAAGAPTTQPASPPAGDPVADPAGPPTGPTGEPAPGATTPASPAPAVEPEGHSGVTEEETLDPAAAADAIAAAERFAEVWGTPHPQWHDQVTALTTPHLGDQLAIAYPPAAEHRVTGDGEIHIGAPEWARVGVPTDDGMVVLDVVLVDGEWLVSGVDWRPE
ncbi:MAG TPA: hypothetical protein VIL37_16700 [Natronosporangium sp.]